MICFTYFWCKQRNINHHRQNGKFYSQNGEQWTSNFCVLTSQYIQLDTFDFAIRSFFPFRFRENNSISVFLSFLVFHFNFRTVQSRVNWNSLTSITRAAFNAKINMRKQMLSSDHSKSMIMSFPPSQNTFYLCSIRVAVILCFTQSPSDSPTLIHRKHEFRQAQSNDFKFDCLIYFGRRHSWFPSTTKKTRSDTEHHKHSSAEEDSWKK